jgi:signal transduction histidine kinase
MAKEQPGEINPANGSNLLKRYDRLLEMTLDLASTLDLGSLLDIIVNAAKELTDSQAAALLLHDPQRNQLYFEAATESLRSDDTFIAIPLDNSIAGWIFQNRKTLRLDDTSSDPHFFREVDLVTSAHAASILGAPLLTKDKTLGVIEAVNKLHGTFDPHDERVLQALAAQAAIAIENTRLFKQSDLIAEMVHELRTPLSALSAAVHLLQRSELAEEQRRKIGQTIYGEVQRLNEMTTNFLELSRLESGRSRFEREPIYLEGLVRECIEILRIQAESEQITLETDIDHGVPTVLGDRGQLKRLLLNLLTNAIKYNSRGGWVRVSIHTRDGMLQMTVEDNGRGIPSDSLPHLFDRFYRVPEQEARTSGTGLGLAIAKRIVQAHNGTIEVESGIGKGTKFIVMLPSGSSEEGIFRS